MNNPEITGSTSVELRANYLEQTFRPLAAHVFASDARAQSLLLCISQHWADEADDAVHIEFIPAVVDQPTWPYCLMNNPFMTDEGSSNSLDDLYPAWSVVQPLIWETTHDLPFLDDNSSAITAFASCCPEETSQEDPIATAFQPYAIAYRDTADDGGDVRIEVVGKVLRPEWEDRFDIIEEWNNVPFDSPEPIDPPPASAPTTPPPAPSDAGADSKPGWLRRLFGGK